LDNVGISTDTVNWPVAGEYVCTSHPVKGAVQPESAVKMRSAGQPIESTPQETVLTTFPPLATVAKTGNVPLIRSEYGDVMLEPAIEGTV
jgi:hypothetical protein